MTTDEAIESLRGLARTENFQAMAHMGINTAHALGVRVPDIRALAKEVGTDHALAQALWDSGLHEARLLATMVADPEQVDAELMESWAADFDSWDLVDQAMGNLFWRAAPAWEQAVVWARRTEPELVRRAGFMLMATLALHDESAADEAFRDFLAVIESEANEERERPRKGLEQALRQIGKRSAVLNQEALVLCERMAEQEGPKPPQWIALEARKDLQSSLVQSRLGGSA